MNKQLFAVFCSFIIVFSTMLQVAAAAGSYDLSPYIQSRFTTIKVAPSNELIQTPSLLTVVESVPLIQVQDMEQQQKQAQSRFSSIAIKSIPTVSATEESNDEK